MKAELGRETVRANGKRNQMRWTLQESDEMDVAMLVLEIATMNELRCV